jgi:hypothetical protein
VIESKVNSSLAGFSARPFYRVVTVVVKSFRNPVRTSLRPVL